jgi:hypothetical protein
MVKRQEPAPPGARLFAERLRNRACKVDLAVAFHQHLDRFHPSFVYGWRTAFMYEFVCEVIDGMPQYLQSMSGLGSDDVRTIASLP